MSVMNLKGYCGIGMGIGNWNEDHGIGDSEQEIVKSVSNTGHQCIVLSEDHFHPVHHYRGAQSGDCPPLRDHFFWTGYENGRLQVSYLHSMGPTVKELQSYIGRVYPTGSQNWEPRQCFGNG